MRSWACRGLFFECTVVIALLAIDKTRTQAGAGTIWQLTTTGMPSRGSRAHVTTLLRLRYRKWITSSRPGKAEEPARLARRLLQLRHARQKCGGNVFALVAADDGTHIGHPSLMNRLQEGYEVQQLCVLRLQLPRIELAARQQQKVLSKCKYDMHSRVSALICPSTRINTALRDRQRRGNPNRRARAIDII